MKRRVLTVITAAAFMLCLMMPLFSAPPVAVTPAMMTANPSSLVESVKLEKVGEKLEIQLLCTKPVEYKVTNMSDPYICLIIDIYSAQLTQKTKLFNNLSCGVVKGVRIGQFSDKPEIVRLVIDLKETTKYEISTSNEKTRLTLSVNYNKEANSSVAVLSTGTQNIQAEPIQTLAAKTGAAITAAAPAKENKALPVESKSNILPALSKATELTEKTITEKKSTNENPSAQKEAPAKIGSKTLIADAVAVSLPSVKAAPEKTLSVKTPSAKTPSAKTRSAKTPDVKLTIKEEQNTIIAVKTKPTKDTEKIKTSEKTLTAIQPVTTTSGAATSGAAASGAAAKVVSVKNTNKEMLSKTTIQDKARTMHTVVMPEMLNELKKNMPLQAAPLQAAPKQTTPSPSVPAKTPSATTVLTEKTAQTNVSAATVSGISATIKKENLKPVSNSNVPKGSIIPIITNLKSVEIITTENNKESPSTLTVKTRPAKAPSVKISPVKTSEKETITLKKQRGSITEMYKSAAVNNNEKQLAYTASLQTAPKTVKNKAVKNNEPKEQLIDVNYDNESVLYILTDLAKRTNKNIVTDSSVTGTVTVSLKKVTLDRALQVILKTSGLGYKKIDNIIIVSKPDNLAKISEVSVKKGFGADSIAVIPIQYASADVLKATVKDIVPELEITIDKRLNAFVISASDSEIKYVKSLVAQLDQLPAISSDPNTITKVIKLKYSKAEDVQTLAAKWYPQVQLILDKRINGFIVKDNKENIDKIEKFIAKVDAPKRQVQLDVKIIDLTESGAKTLGVTWNSNSNIMSTTFQEVAYNGVAWQDVNNANWPPTTAPTNNFQNLPFAGFGRKPLTYTMAINYLVTKGEAKILGTPKVVTLSGESATIMVGQHYPITYTDPRAGVLQAEYIDIAIKLAVKPVITPDGYIMMEVAPEISELAASSSGSQYPETITRSVKTNVIVKEGDTIILGGLYRKDFRTTKNKIPFLGDIPFAGEMFKNTTDASSKDEVVIMITPKLVDVE